MVPGLEDRLLGGSEEDVIHIAEMVGAFEDKFTSFLAYL
jgi:hypothetical protein